MHLLSKCNLSLSHPNAASFAHRDRLAAAPPRSCGTVEVFLFGQLRIHIQGNVAHIRNKKARELLALLLVEKRGPIRKLWTAETLWPSVDQQQAMDSLYKVLRFWRKDPVLSQWFPLENVKGELSLRSSNILCDLWRYEEAASTGDIAMKEEAAALYTDPLLFQEYYEWTAEKEAFCDLRQAEMLNQLLLHYTQLDDRAKITYYEKKQALL